MAELGTAASVLQIAGLGAELCKLMWKSGNDVRHANKDVDDIRTEVRSTSKALESLGKFLQQDEAEQSRAGAATLTDEARLALADCLRNCRNAFAELENALQSARRSTTYGGVTILAKWKWPLKKWGTQSMQAKLRGLTSVLSLMFQILEYARKRELHAISVEDRNRVERLVQSNEELVQMLTANVRSLDLGNATTPTGPQGATSADHELTPRQAWSMLTLLHLELHTSRGIRRLRTHLLVLMRHRATLSRVASPQSWRHYLTLEEQLHVLPADFCCHEHGIEQRFDTFDFFSRHQAQEHDHWLSDASGGLDKAVENLLPTLSAKHLASVTRWATDCDAGPMIDFEAEEDGEKEEENPSLGIQLASIGALGGKELNDVGETVDDEGGDILGVVEDEGMKQKIVDGEIDPNTIKMDDEGQIVDKQGVILHDESIDAPKSPLSAHSPRDNLTPPELPRRRRSGQEMGGKPVAPPAPPPPPPPQYSGHGIRVASTASQSRDKPYGIRTACVASSGYRSQTTRRGQPPTNPDGTFYCDFTPRCESLVFDRKCEWSKHMDRHDRMYRCPYPTCAELQGFNSYGDLLRHKRAVRSTHSGRGIPLVCSFKDCERQTGESFASKEDLDERVRRVHCLSQEEEEEEEESPAAWASSPELRSRIVVRQRQSLEERGERISEAQTPLAYNSCSIGKRKVEEAEAEDSEALLHTSSVERSPKRRRSNDEPTSGTVMAVTSSFSSSSGKDDQSAPPTRLSDRAEMLLRMWVTVHS